MTEYRQVHLGGLALAVPRLPLRITRTVYPLCQKLTDAKFLDRVGETGGSLACADQTEFDDLANIAFGLASAADPNLTRQAFDDLPIAPPELIDAFIAARYQTGAWIEAVAGSGDAQEEEAPGEARGAEAPQ